MNSGLREFFVHGREVYDFNRNLILECCRENNMKFNPLNFPTYDYYLDMYRNNDIVHFEHYAYEDKITCEETLQSGYDCSTVGNHDAYFFPLEIQEDYLVFASFDGSVKVTHLSLVTSRQLKDFMKEMKNPHLANRKRLLIKSKFLRARTTWNKNYTRGILIQTLEKAISLYTENQRHQILKIATEAITQFSDLRWPHPVTQEEFNRIFNNISISNSRSSLTMETVDQQAEVTRHQVLDVSSGEAEHNLQHDYNETLQSSEEVILSFADESRGEIGQIGSGLDPTRHTSVYKDAAISHFLERPVLISTQTWTENTNVDISVAPFYQFFNDSRIKNKVTNYSLVRCNLKIKVLINASPFYYGNAKTIWKPLTDYCPDNWVVVPGQEGWKVPYSQVPGFYIQVEKNQGGEMTLPFFYHKNWLRITSADETTKMGILQIKSFTPLLNANSVASSDVTIQIYAWAENVELSGPTISEALQSGDEYKSSGPISGPASAIAEASGSLAKIPVIRPFALATQMVSSSVADVARFFGFTNVANLQSEVPQHPGAFAGMSSTNMMTPYESLTVDDKNELTIDPRVAGIKPVDELMISEFLSRESWIWQSNWSSSSNVDTILFLSRVMPDLIRNDGTTLYRQSSPMAHINRLFAYWKGPIKFRFKFICSKYHRGRVRITYDPDGDLFTNSVTSSTSVTRIVDISEESDIEMVIPYMQAVSFLKTAYGEASFVQQMNGGSAALTRDSNSDNGQISVRIFTKQTSPVSDAPIIMQVFVSASDMEFAAPVDAPKDYSFEALQSGAETSTVTTNVEDHEDHIYQVHFGERITSLRQLFRRKNLYYVAQCLAGSDANDNAVTINTLTLPRLPVPYGYAPNGGFLSPGIAIPSNQYPANYVANTPLSLIMPCFVGVTGSIVYSINVDSSYPVGSVYATRSHESYTSSAVGFKPKVLSQYITSSYGAVSRLAYRTLPTGAAGRVLTNQYTQAGLSFKVPMYSNRRFLATDQDNIQSAIKVDGTELDTFTVTLWMKPNGHSAVESSTQAQFYYMAGADFNLLYMRNVPTIYVYTLPAPTG
jgi:hypothetical protein